MRDRPLNHVAACAHLSPSAQFAIANRAEGEKGRESKAALPPQLEMSGSRSFPRKPFDFAHGPELVEGRESSSSASCFQGFGQ